MERILSILNDEQKNAVNSKAKYLQISAGPGTGKTSTLAARILNLQNEFDFNRNNLLAISFSRSAKQQLINKMKNYTEILGYGSIIEILTFHSLAHRIIRYGIYSGETKFKNGFKTIQTEEFVKKKPSITHGLCPVYADRDLIGTALSKGLNLLRQGAQVNGRIYHHWSIIDSNCQFKVNLEEGQRVIIEGKDMIEFWKRVEKTGRIQNLIDYQGLINEATRILEKNAETTSMISRDLRHILVDKYQDTSLSQENFLYSLAGIERNITVVGDKNQAIYTFNGSNPENLERFYTHFNKINPENTERISLKKNYRSTKGIVELSNHFLGNNCIEVTKESESVKPVVINTHSIELAANYIAGKIQDLKHNKDVSYSDICILYRKNTDYSPQGETVREELTKYNIPWKQMITAAKSENKFDTTRNVLSLCDEYPSYELQELLEIIERSQLSISISGIVKDAILQGAEDTDDLIDYIIDLDEMNQNDSLEAVTLSSVHGAKGLEYPIVFIVYLGDRSFPHSSHPDIDEEKRLLYVGITRAMNELYVLGQPGIQFENFLGELMSSESAERVEFHTKYKEGKKEGFSEEERNLINETSKQLEIKEKIRMEELLKQMNNEW